MERQPWTKLLKNFPCSLSSPRIWYNIHFKIIHWEKSGVKTWRRATLENSAILGGWSRFFLNGRPLTEAKPLGIWRNLDLLGENRSIFGSGGKLVIQMELSYGPGNGSRGGAILAPLIFSVNTINLHQKQDTLWIGNLINQSGLTKSWHTKFLKSMTYLLKLLFE